MAQILLVAQGVRVGRLCLRFTSCRIAEFKIAVFHEITLCSFSRNKLQGTNKKMVGNKVNMRIEKCAPVNFWVGKGLVRVTNWNQTKSLESITTLWGIIEQVNKKKL